MHDGVQCSVLCPTELVRGRLQVKTDPGRASGLVHCVKEVYRQQGLRNIYAGAFFSFINFPCVAISLSCPPSVPPCCLPHQLLYQPTNRVFVCVYPFATLRHPFATLSHHSPHSATLSPHSTTLSPHSATLSPHLATFRHTQPTFTRQERKTKSAESRAHRAGVGCSSLAYGRAVSLFLVGIINISGPIKTDTLQFIQWAKLFEAWAVITPPAPSGSRAGGRAW